ncbi:hypothetical protein ACONW8_004081 [Yersinia enterocolitica]
MKEYLATLKKIADEPFHRAKAEALDLTWEEYLELNPHLKD